jgi:hypothetical protein
MRTNTLPQSDSVIPLGQFHPEIIENGEIHTLMVGWKYTHVFQREILGNYISRVRRTTDNYEEIDLTHGVLIQFDKKEIKKSFSYTIRALLKKNYFYSHFRKNTYIIQNPINIPTHIFSNSKKRFLGSLERVEMFRVELDLPHTHQGSINGSTPTFRRQVRGKGRSVLCGYSFCFLYTQHLHTSYKFGKLSKTH